jgi:para-nitrobenzyl esterase
MEPIRIESGHISGTELGESEKKVYVYRGIPYTAPPVGDLRWKPPKAVVPWKGIRQSKDYSVQAAHFPDVNLPIKEQHIPMSEDCLYLNVLTPAKTANDGLPVMVWFHGGILRYGSANWSLYNGPGLPLHGVVLVTVNTRLGVLGLMAHPLLSQESPNGVSGTYLFLDMIASLQWVQRNIAAFGGDPDNVTIFGESGGGIKVVSLIASPLAQGLFHKAICESGGSNVTPTPMRDLEILGEKLFTRLGVDKERDPLAAARALSWEKVIEVDQALNVEMGPPFTFIGSWNVSVDGWFMTDNPPSIFKAGKQNAVPLIVVANLGELTGPGFIPNPKMIPGYVNLLAGVRKANVKGFAGIFDQVPINWRQEGAVSSHAMEMHYVFGALDNLEAWNTIFSLYASAGAKSPTPLMTNIDQRVSEAMMTMWTQFAKKGDPSVEGMVMWPDYEEATDRYLYIADPLQVKSGFSQLLQSPK